jgi:hypothetical protein
MEDYKNNGIKFLSDSKAVGLTVGIMCERSYLS